jgi:hypothetical protein
MIFSSFFEEFPELVEREFRNIFVLDNGAHKYIPPGNYAFLELFCPNIDCDCRKVIINIVSVNPTKVWAILNYGWESEEYYKLWWGADSQHYRPMSGVTLDPPTKNPLKNEFLAVFQDIIKQDQGYAERLEKHYRMFKEKIRKKERKQATIKKLTLNASSKKAGRNDPCPCNSGNKFKKCCLLKVIN